MDYIKSFDIQLDKSYFYAGESVKGHVVIINIENIKVRAFHHARTDSSGDHLPVLLHDFVTGSFPEVPSELHSSRRIGVRVFLRGKCHVEWKITRGGERRTVKEDQYFIDDKAIVWGKDKHDDGTIGILPRGSHHLPFDFQLPECALPCSFESRIGTIRYYLRVIIDIPYASPPQGLKYFTIIGPCIDCMEARYLSTSTLVQQVRHCCLCCAVGPVSVEATLERSAYCCGENIRLKCELQNGSGQNTWLICRLIQVVEYHINKGVLGLTKNVRHKVWEYQGPTVPPHTTKSFLDLHRHLQVPVMPSTLADVCKLIEIYYVLQVCLGMEKSGENLDIVFPLDIATVPYRIPSHPSPELTYEIAANNVEGGIYISPEFQLGQVYDGTMDHDTEVILYRPVYVTVPHKKVTVSNANNASPCIASTRQAGNDCNRPLLDVNNQGPEQVDDQQTSV